MSATKIYTEALDMAKFYANILKLRTTIFHHRLLLPTFFAMKMLNSWVHTCTLCLCNIIAGC